MRATYWNSSPFTRCAGISSTSRRLRSGNTTRWMPARLAASTFSLMPPTGSTFPRRVISPVIATSDAALRPVRREASEVTIATPAEGPSLGTAPAGVAMVTSLASLLTGRAAHPDVAMTGEITLRGKVLPVGGIKEKVLAAKRAGIRRVILPERNRRDVSEIQPELLKGLDVEYVGTIDEALSHTLAPAAA